MNQSLESPNLESLAALQYERQAEMRREAHTADLLSHQISMGDGLRRKLFFLALAGLVLMALWLAEVAPATDERFHQSPYASWSVGESLSDHLNLPHPPEFRLALCSQLLRHDILKQASSLLSRLGIHWMRLCPIFWPGRRVANRF